MPPPEEPPPPPHEPEIEFLAALARRALVVLRAALFVAGIVAFVVTVQRIVTLDDEALPARIAHNLLWAAVGLPLVLPSDWMFGRGRWLTLAAAAAIWLLPMLLEGDHAYGWVLRFAGSFCGTMTIVVWRTLAGLTRGGSGVSPAG